jgi:hypothetical protein
MIWLIEKKELGTARNVTQVVVKEVVTKGLREDMLLFLVVVTDFNLLINKIF